MHVKELHMFYLNNLKLDKCIYTSEIPFKALTQLQKTAGAVSLIDVRHSCFFYTILEPVFCRRTAVNGTRASNKTERLFPHMHLHCGSIHIFCSSLIVNYEAYFIDIRPNFLLSIIVTLRYRKYEYIITSYFSHVFDNYHSSVLPKNIWFLRNKNTVNLI